MTTNTHNKELLTAIINELSDPEFHFTTESLWADVFETGLEPLAFELAVYSLEAISRQNISQSFYEGTVDKFFDITIADLVDEYLEDEISDDPLFVMRIMAKLMESVIMDQQPQEDEE